MKGLQKKNKDNLIKLLHKEVTDINDNPKYEIKELEKMSPKNLVNLYLVWNSIIGYTDDFINFIEIAYMIKLDKIGKVLSDSDIEKLTNDREEILEVLYNDIFDSNIDPKFPPHPDYLEDFNDFDDFYKAPANSLVEIYFDWEGVDSNEIINLIKDAYMIDNLENKEELHQNSIEPKIKQENTSNFKIKM